MLCLKLTTLYLLQVYRYRSLTDSGGTFFEAMLGRAFFGCVVGLITQTIIIGFNGFPYAALLAIPIVGLIFVYHVTMWRFGQPHAGLAKLAEADEAASPAVPDDQRYDYVQPSWRPERFRPLYTFLPYDFVEGDDGVV